MSSFVENDMLDGAFYSIFENGIPGSQLNLFFVPQSEDGLDLD
jgi:hypothetical protein